MKLWLNSLTNFAKNVKSMFLIGFKNIKLYNPKSTLITTNILE